MNKKSNELKPVGSSMRESTPHGPERKRRRLAATIPLPEPDRPRLPASADTASVFDSVAWRTRWGGIRPVAETVSVYVAGCSGTMELGGVIGWPVFKVGTSQDVGARITKLNQQRYGALVIDAFAMVEESGFGDWEAARLSCRPTHPASPVRALPRSLLVELPFWLSTADFEALVVAALEPVSLIHLAANPIGRSLCRRRGCDRDRLLRYSRSAAGPVLATEIAAIAPSGDAARLVALIEWILIHVVRTDGGGR